MLISSAFTIFIFVFKVLHGIVAGFEAPLQMTITLWLAMRGVLDLDLGGTTEVTEVEDDYRNTLYLPSIPRISLFFSLCSAISACYRMNVPLPYLDYSKENLQSRWKTMFFQSLGQTPYFICSVVFRVMSYAFMWTFLHVYAPIPMILIFISNVASGYHVADKKHIKDKIKQMETEVKYLYETYGEESREVRYNTAVWMNSFVGMFIPCGYIERLDDARVITMENMELQFRKDVKSGIAELETTFDAEVERLINSVREFRAKHPTTTDEDKKRFNDQVAKKLKNYKGAIQNLAKDYGWEYQLGKEDKFNEDESKTFKERVDHMKETVKTELNKIRERPSILYSLDKLHHEIRTEIIKGQDTVALSICLFSAFLGMILINQGAFGYPPNFINNYNFNVFSGVLITLGVMCLVFVTIKFNILGFLGLDHKDTKHRERRANTDNDKSGCQRTTILRFVVVIFSVAIVVAPLVVGFMFSKGGETESFLVIGSDPTATDDTLRVDMFKVHPVNDKAEDFTLTSTTKIVSCKDNNFDDAPIVVPGDEEESVTCRERIENIKETEIVLLQENWNYRSSSPFPSEDENGQNIEDFKDTNAPVFSLRKEDVEAFNEATKGKSKSRVKVERNSKTVFEEIKKAEDDLFLVVCEPEICLDLRFLGSENCLSNDSKSYFLGSVDDGFARRRVSVTLECSDNGKPCRELKNFKTLLEKENPSGCKASLIPIAQGSVKTKEVALKCNAKARPGVSLGDLQYWNWYQSDNTAWFKSEEYEWRVTGSEDKCEVKDKKNGEGIRGNRCFIKKTGNTCAEEWDQIKVKFQ